MKRGRTMGTKNRAGERVPRVRCVSAHGPSTKVPGALKNHVWSNSGSRRRPSADPMGLQRGADMRTTFRGLAKFLATFFTTKRSAAKPSAAAGNR